MTILINAATGLEDDFHLTQADEAASHDIYDSYLKAKSLCKQLPKKSLQPTGSDLVGFIKEIHASKHSSAALFRKNTDASQALATLWLSRCRTTAQSFSVLNGIQQFDGISLETMASLAKLSALPSNLRLLQEQLCNLGIVLIYERAIAGMKLDGAAFRLGNGTPVIALSLRYPRLDYFWFTLMHELAHVGFHYEHLSSPIVDDIEGAEENEIEVEANRIAANALISRSDWRSCNALYVQKDEEVISFAKRVGVHPAIVAGRIKKELNRHTLFSRIINEIDVRKILLDE
jgi:HTH-type transcriptional regulator/antitoxin HigA